jgi:carbon-monoxide dehydrogenase iron sulfur subunit
MRIAVLPERCVGCRVCELVCSEFHEGEFRPSRACIQVLSFDESVQDVPIVCQQCPDAPCIAVCPQDALHRDEQTDAVVVDPELCIQCLSCIEACIVGNGTIKGEEKLVIKFDEDKQIPSKCDLCLGDPQCVKFCPTQALILTEDSPGPDEIGVNEMTEALTRFIHQENLPRKQESR